MQFPRLALPTVPVPTAMERVTGKFHRPENKTYFRLPDFREKILWPTVKKAPFQQSVNAWAQWRQADIEKAEREAGMLFLLYARPLFLNGLGHDTQIFT